MSEEVHTTLWIVGVTLGVIAVGLVVLVVAISLGAVSLVGLVQRNEQRRKSEIGEALKALGLTVEPTAVQAGWGFLARGTWRGTALAVGERSHVRTTTDGPSTVTYIEVASIARSNLGKFSVVSKLTSAPQDRPPDALRTGDANFDKRFTVTEGGMDDARQRSTAFDHGAANAQIPWLDEKVRAMLAGAGALEALIVSDTSVSVLIRWQRATFWNAVDLALYLACWPTGPAQTYR